jgi:hypothetical protein
VFKLAEGHEIYQTGVELQAFQADNAELRLSCRGHSQYKYNRAAIIMKKAVPILLLVILFGGAAWYSFVKDPAEVHELPVEPAPPVIQTPEKEAEPEPEPPADDMVVELEPEPIILPDPLLPLNESDPQFTLELSEVTGPDPLKEYLVKSQAISRIVAMLDSLTSRQVPVQTNPIKPADGKFIADAEGERYVMSAQNFARYDGYVALIQSTDTDALLALYQRFYPLFQQAWEEIGGSGQFSERLNEVIDDLLDTPDVPGPVYLTKPEAFYLFEEPELEALTAGQKILIRMGSVNASIVKEKLREIREIL